MKASSMIATSPQKTGGFHFKLSHRILQIMIEIGLGLFLIGLIPAPFLLGQTLPPESQHTYTFGQSLTITLQLPDGTWMPEANLFLHTTSLPIRVYARSLQNRVAIYSRDLRESPLEPFEPVTYYWEYKTASGETLRTPETTFTYEDNRYRWKEKREGLIILRWISGSDETMANALEIANNALNEIQATLNTSSMEPTTLYIYPSLTDLQSALRLGGKDWIGGEAQPEIGVILLAIPSTSTAQAILQMERDIPHELTHYILYSKIGAAAYDNLPTWLNEGLASQFEQRLPEPENYDLLLKRHHEQATLTHFMDLCSPFSLDAEEARLAYAESRSMVNYLRQTYGWGTLNQLVQTYTEGLDCSAGVQHTYNMDLPALEQQWRGWLENQLNPNVNTPSPLLTEIWITLRDLSAWLLIVASLLLPGIVILLSLRHSRP